MRWPVIALLVSSLLGACGSSSAVGPLRFHNQPIVWQVADRDHVADKPADRPFVRALYHIDQPIFRRLHEAMAVHEPRHAMDVNALDEVPDSTWFTNRAGQRQLTPAEIARGPNTTDGPDSSAPWQVVSSKVGGQSVGFIIEDARGDRYLLKFDEPEFPVMETATDVVVQRLLWAVGYHVPEDSIVYFDRSQLVLSDKASIKDVFGNKRRMTVRDLEGSLAKVRSDNGRFRGLTSKFLPGVPIGGFPQSGVRADDPNDTIPHEHRRTLRGLRMFYAWLQYTDAKENNTLDIWRTDPADDSRRYVVHYLVDFGKSLGANSTMARYNADGHAYMIDLVDVPLQLLTLGLVKRAWEGTYDPGIVGVGRFDVDHFEPGSFYPHDPYEPFVRMLPEDAFWAAKILIHLTREQIRAAVEQGRYPDPRAVDYLTDTLVGRQRKLARHWFREVAPLDRFRLTSTGDAYRLCFDDLELVYELGGVPSATTYAAASFDYAGAATGWRASVGGSAGGQACLDGLRPGSTHGGYTIVRITLSRGKTFEPVMLHLGRAPDGGLRVIGIRR